MIYISGSRGLVGGQLSQKLVELGHEVCPLIRKKGDSPGVMWSEEKGLENPSELEGAEAVIHLAGENVFAWKWSESKKEKIRNSRVLGTKRISQQLAGLKTPPKIFICASAIGFYGSRADEWMDESSSVGQGFLADVVKEWEESTVVAREAGIRTVNLRIGVAL